MLPELGYLVAATGESNRKTVERLLCDGAQIAGCLELHGDWCVNKTLLPVPQAENRSKGDRFGKTNIMLVPSIVGFAFSAVAFDRSHRRHCACSGAVTRSTASGTSWREKQDFTHRFVGIALRGAAGHPTSRRARPIICDII